MLARFGGGLGSMDTLWVAGRGSSTTTSPATSARHSTSSAVSQGGDPRADNSIAKDSSRSTDGHAAKFKQVTGLPYFNGVFDPEGKRPLRRLHEPRRTRLVKLERAPVMEHLLTAAEG